MAVDTQPSPAKSKASHFPTARILPSNFKPFQPIVGSSEEVEEVANPSDGDDDDEDDNDDDDPPEVPIEADPPQARVPPSPGPSFGTRSQSTTRLTSEVSHPDFSTVYHNPPKVEVSSLKAGTDPSPSRPATQSTKKAAQRKTPAPTPSPVKRSKASAPSSKKVLGDLEAQIPEINVSQIRELSSALKDIEPVSLVIVF